MFSAALNKLIETFLMCMLAFLCLIECSDLNRWQYLTVEDITEQHYKKQKCNGLTFIVLFLYSVEQNMTLWSLGYHTVR